MTRLIVRSKDAPVKSIMAIMATWGELAGLIEEKVTLPKGCKLVWDLHFQHVGYRGHFLTGILSAFGGPQPEAVDCWEAYTVVTVAYACPAISEGKEDQMVDLPLISVSEVMLNDDGTFFWRNKMAKVAENTADVEQLVVALNGGTLPNGHRYMTGIRFPETTSE